MKLPTAGEINVHNSLDEISACEHFLDKTLPQAEALFRDNSSYYQEDLMWMGPRAFQFYLLAATSYLRSAEAVGDDHMIDCLYEIVMFRSSQEGFSLAVDHANDMIDCIIGDYEKFEVNQEIYGDLKEKYRHLQDQISSMD